MNKLLDSFIHWLRGRSEGFLQPESLGGGLGTAGERVVHSWFYLAWTVTCLSALLCWKRVLGELLCQTHSWSITREKWSRTQKTNPWLEAQMELLVQHVIQWGEVSWPRAEGRGQPVHMMDRKHGWTNVSESKTLYVQWPPPKVLFSFSLFYLLQLSVWLLTNLCFTWEMFVSPSGFYHSIFLTQTVHSSLFFLCDVAFHYYV